MCGITGFIGTGKTPASFNVDKMNLLMFWNNERGGDATGIFTPTHGVVKTTKEAPEFLKDGKLLLNQDNIFIGHLRSGTSGDKTNVNNAHPFEFNSLVGVHNGTLRNIWNILKKEGIDKEKEKIGVDSEALYRIINEKGPNIISEIDGAMALVWYDRITNDIKVYRNKERPLYYGYDDNGDIYLSSIKEALNVIGCCWIEEFDVETLYTINNNGLSDVILTIPAYKAPEVKSKFSKFIGAFGRKIREKHHYNSGFMFSHLSFYHSISEDGDTRGITLNNIDDKKDHIMFRLDEIIENKSKQNFCGMYNAYQPVERQYTLKVTLYKNGSDMGQFYIDGYDRILKCFINEESFKDKGFLGGVAVCNISQDYCGKSYEIVKSGEYVQLNDCDENAISFEVTEDNGKTYEETIEDFTSFIPIYDAEDLMIFKAIYNEEDLKKMSNSNQEEQEEQKDWYMTSHEELVQFKKEIEEIIRKGINESKDCTIDNDFTLIQTSMFQELDSAFETFSDASYYVEDDMEEDVEENANLEESEIDDDKVSSEGHNLSED